MKGFWNDIIWQLNIAPSGVYVVLLLLFIVGCAALLALYGKRKEVVKFIFLLLLGEYVFLIYGVTVIFREPSSRLSNVFKPFWSYKELIHGEMPPLIYEMVMNVVFFIPIGILLGTQVTKLPTRKQWLSASLLGLSLSIGIELLQLFFKKGSFEIDDIIHNTSGCLMGFAIWRGCTKLLMLIKRHNGNN